MHFWNVTILFYPLWLINVAHYFLLNVFHNGDSKFRRVEQIFRIESDVKNKCTYYISHTKNYIKKDFELSINFLSSKFQCRKELFLSENNQCIIQFLFVSDFSRDHPGNRAHASTQSCKFPPTSPHIFLVFKWKLVAMREIHFYWASYSNSNMNIKQSESIQFWRCIYLIKVYLI